MLKTGKAVTVEHTHFDKDNNEVYVEVFAHPVRNKEGKVIQVVHFARNITDRKKAEKALRESEQKLRDVIDNSSDAIVWVDTTGKITLVNKKGFELTGWSEKELIGKNFMDVEALTQESKEKILEGFMKRIEGIDTPPYEVEVVTKNGEIIPTELSASLISEGDKIVGTQSIFRDLRERKKMEKKLMEYSQHLEEIVEKRTRELKESEAKLKDLFKTIPDGIAIVDLDGDLLEFNETTLELFGYSREEIIGKNVFDFVAEEDRERVVWSFEQTLKEGAIRIQFPVLGKDGRKIPIELNASALKDPKGNLMGFVAVLRDITERKRMEEQLLKSERLAAVGQLSTMVGHDLRNPLTSIQNACYYLKMKLGASKDEKVKKMFEVIDKEIDYANNIVKDLLDFSRVKKPELKKVDLVLAIQDALAQLEFPENITLATKFSEVPATEADPDQLRRVFQNIALNGIQAMPYGGELTVSTRKSGDFIEVAFTDTGIGIPKDSLDKLFTPLFTTKSQGVGLGLAICKNIVEGHNGKIEVKSKVGERSTFTVKLPIHQTKGGKKQT